MQVSNEAKKKVEESIVVTGSARSGTTIIGSLIHSFQDVEYSFEPPTMFSLFYDLMKVSEDYDRWKLLYETYLYEDFFLNSVSGRAINCNLHDDSSIYKVKSLEEIDKKLNQYNRKLLVEKLASKGRIAYKMPDSIGVIKKLISLYPDMKVVLMNRDIVSTVNSLVKKSWFSDLGLRENYTSPISLYKGYNMPFWLEPNLYGYFLSLNEVERCTFYYLEMSKKITGRNILNISYSDLILDPHKVASYISDSLNLSFGNKTVEIISSIKYQKKERDFKIFDKMKDIFLLERLNSLIYE